MTTITMKYILTKIVLVWAALAAIVGISKKRENESLNDAIKFPDMGKTAVVEDFEMAAYHNQAGISHQVSTERIILLNN
jgi:CRISPR/Cas system-associated endonuclease Cas3-HD